MYVRARVCTETRVRLEFLHPVPLHVYNAIRRALYVYCPVWAFDSVHVNKNPFHNAMPSELVEEKLKQIIVACERTHVPLETLRMLPLNAFLKPIPIHVRVVRGSDVGFESSAAYGSMNPMYECSLFVSNGALPIVSIPAYPMPPFVEPRACDTHGRRVDDARYRSALHHDLDVSLQGSFASANDARDACQRYAVNAVRLELAPDSDDADERVACIVYQSRGHYTDPTVVFTLGMHAMLESLEALKNSFLDALHDENACE
jgi:hypothetical protein